MACADGQWWRSDVGGASFCAPCAAAGIIAELAMILVTSAMNLKFLRPRIFEYFRNAMRAIREIWKNGFGINVQVRSPSRARAWCPCHREHSLLCRRNDGSDSPHLK